MALVKTSFAAKLLQRVATWYQGQVGKSLAQYGLKYDDLRVETPEVQEAMRWITKEEYELRTKRVARAFDCSMKRTYLPEELQAVQRPLEGYLDERIKDAKTRLDERAELTKW